jgi:2-oxoglutarate dehydrogenase complex dehydrogenase (E1) component-like enzyme
VSEKIRDLSEYISEQFGANASYVEGLLNRFKANPNAVDESGESILESFSAVVTGRAKFPRRLASRRQSRKLKRP